MQAQRFGALEQALANYRYDEIHHQIKQLEKQFVMLPPDLAEKVEQFKELSIRVQGLYQMAERLDKKPWSEKDGFKMRIANDGSVLEMMCQTNAEINPFNYCALFYEMEYYQKWLDKGISTIDQGNLGVAEKASSIRMDIALLSPRKAIVQGLGLDRLASRGELIVVGFDWVNTPYNVKRLGKKLLLKEGQVPVKDLKIMYQLVLKPKPRFRMVCTMDFEVSMVIIPDALIDAAAGYFMRFMLQNMERLGKDLDQDYIRRIKQDKDRFYQWVRETLTRAFGPGCYPMVS